ncbi:MAG: hypothetical protein ABSD12_02175 [Paraburkholderia sp.]|jgi:hypothetical protein
MIGADYATRAVMNTRKNRMPDIFNLCVEAAATGSGRVASQMYAWGRFHRKIAVFAAFFAAFRRRVQANYWRGVRDVATGCENGLKSFPSCGRE